MRRTFLSLAIALPLLLPAPCQDPGEGPQAEGMVVDPLTTRFAEKVKEFGVPAAYDPVEEECIVDWAGDPGEGGGIAADVEGLTIFGNTARILARRRHLPSRGVTALTSAQFSGRDRGIGRILTATGTP